MKKKIIALGLVLSFLAAPIASAQVAGSSVGGLNGFRLLSSTFSTAISSWNGSFGTSTAYAKLTVWGSSTSTASRAFEVANTASTTIFAVNNGGKIMGNAGTASTSVSVVGGILSATTTQTANGANLDTIFHQLTFKSNTLALEGQSFSYFAAGTFAANADADKTVSVKLVQGGATTTIFTSGNSAITQALDWTLSGECIRKSNAELKCGGDLTVGTTTFSDYNALTPSLSNDLVVAITGSSTSASSVTGELYKVRWNEAP